MSELRDKPAGSLRITTGIHAAQAIVWPAVGKLLSIYPDIQVEISVHSDLSTSLRSGSTQACGSARPLLKIWSRCGSVRRCEWRPSPRPPISPPADHPGRRDDLAEHNCVNLRFPTRGGLYAWEFEKAGRALNVRLEGQLIVNEIALALQAAIDGLGVAYLPEDYVQSDIEAGRLTRVLESWCPPFPGYHLYYPSRRHQSPAFTVLVEALRYRG